MNTNKTIHAPVLKISVSSPDETKNTKKRKQKNYRKDSLDIYKITLSVLNMNMGRTVLLRVSIKIGHLFRKLIFVIG